MFPLSLSLNYNYWVNDAAWESVHILTCVHFISVICWYNDHLIRKYSLLNFFPNVLLRNQKLHMRKAPWSWVNRRFKVENFYTFSHSSSHETQRLQKINWNSFLCDFLSERISFQVVIYDGNSFIHFTSFFELYQVSRHLSEHSLISHSIRSRKAWKVWCYVICCRWPTRTTSFPSISFLTFLDFSNFSAVIPQTCRYKSKKYECGLSISCVLNGGR